MSSVKSVSVFERRACCALSAEMCDCVWDAKVERDGAGCCGFPEEGEGRWVFRYSVGENVGERKGSNIGSESWGFIGPVISSIRMEESSAPSQVEPG